MNKDSSRKLLYPIIITAVLQHLFLSHNVLTNDFLTNIITFLSILFGFYITSLTIFATSSYLPKLYKIHDSENIGNTLLNTLMNNYKLGLRIALLSIIYFLSIQFFVVKNITDPIFFNNIWLLPFSGILILNFFYSYSMLNDLFNIIIQDAKIDKLSKRNKQE